MGLHRFNVLPHAGGARGAGALTWLPGTRTWSRGTDLLNSCERGPLAQLIPHHYLMAKKVPSCFLLLSAILWSPQLKQPTFLSPVRPTPSEKPRLFESPLCFLMLSVSYWLGKNDSPIQKVLARNWIASRMNERSPRGMIQYSPLEGLIFS